MATWEAKTRFDGDFCLNSGGKERFPFVGCMVAKGINRGKTIQKAKDRCAQNAECRAVWCCATGCPSTTCYATKATAPNYKAADCPDAPGSFRESKYANTFYVKDAEGPPPEPEHIVEPAPSPPVPPVPESEDAPPAPQDGGTHQQNENQEDSKIYKLLKSKSMCRFGRGVRYTKLQGEKTVDDCAEAVKQRNGAAFGWLARKKLCVMAPKPFSECKIRRGQFDLYEIDPFARDDQPEDR